MTHYQQCALLRCQSCFCQRRQIYFEVLKISFWNETLWLASIFGKCPFHVCKCASGCVLLLLFPAWFPHFPLHQRHAGRGHMWSALSGDAGHATGRASNWSELSRRGGVFVCVCVCVCVVHVPGRLPSYRVAHIKVPDETNAGGNGFGVAPGREVKRKAGLGQPWPEMNLEQVREKKEEKKRQKTRLIFNVLHFHVCNS